MSRVRWWWIAVSLVVLVVSAIGVICWGWSPYVAPLASVGTAIGTVGLALWTVRLALVTTESVSTAREGLELARAGHKVALEQQRMLREELKQMGAQTEVARASAEAAHVASSEAAKTRIDAISPLVTLALVNAEVLVRRSASNGWGPVSDAAGWELTEIEEGMFRIRLQFRLHNYGKSPASLHFGDIAASFEQVKRSGRGYRVLEPGETYEDVLVVTPTRAETLDSKEIAVVVTCNGLFYRAHVDRIQWNGHLQAVELRGGRAWPIPEDRIANSNGGYVFREYPALERPAEAAAYYKKIVSEGKADD